MMVKKRLRRPRSSSFGAPPTTNRCKCARNAVRFRRFESSHCVEVPMPMNESRAELVVDISRRFMDLLRQLEPNWKTGYLRFRLDSTRYGCTASCDIGSDVLMIDAVKNDQFFAHISEQGRKFLRNLGKSRGVFILVADSSSKYN